MTGLPKPQQNMVPAPSLDLSDEIINHRIASFEQEIDTLSQKQGLLERLLELRFYMSRLIAQRELRRIMKSSRAKRGG
jgi:hypothetical protein